MKKKAFFSLLIFTAFVFPLLLACNKQNGGANANTTVLNKRLIKDKILLILGKDYYTRHNILDYLQKEYGIGEGDSPVKIFGYDEMLKKSKQPVLKTISEKVAEYNPTVVISLGIPEGGGRYLINELQKNSDLAIVTLLPMDDILPLEAGSDLVVDFEIPTGILNDEKDFKISDETLSLLLNSSVFMGEYIRAKKNNTDKAPNKTPIEDFSEVFLNTQAFLNINPKIKYAIKPHIDPDTGIPSRKYLLVYEGSSGE